jgi:alpha-L-fucosidase 2
MVKHILPLFLLLLFSGCQKHETNNNTIWSDKPAGYFEEAFPLGNGFTGVMVSGGVKSEDLLLNESTLWVGGPVNAEMNPDAWKNLAAVRKALFSEDYRSAEKLVRKLQGTFSASYAPLGNLVFTFTHGDSATSYSRSLDLPSAISTVKYQSGTTLFERETFVSNPDRVIVMRLKSSAKGELGMA